MNINLSVKFLKTLLPDSQCTLDNDFVIKRIASLTHAQTEDLAVIFDPGNASVFEAVPTSAISACKAGLFLAATVSVPGKSYFLVPDPLEAYQKIVKFVEDQARQCQDQPLIAADAYVHPSAIVDQGARIESGTVIGAHVYVGKKVLIGKNSILHPGVRILDNCSIGNNSIIQAGAIIGSDGFGYQVTKHGARKIPHIGIVVIGSEVEIGANTSIDRAVFEKTVIEDGVKIDNNVHIAHNVTVGRGSVILALTGIAGSVKIGQGCQIGGQVAIKDHVTIGNRVKIVSQSAVISDLPDNSIVAGSPSMPFGQWKRICVLLNKLPEMVKSVQKIEQLATAYTHKQSWLRRFFGSW